MFNFFFRLLFIFIFLVFSNSYSSSPKETGMVTMSQPGGTQFNATYTADGVLWEWVTDDGYNIYQNATTGWFYYAQIGTNGDFEPTSYRVGIDSPPAYSYDIDRTQARIDELETEAASARENLQPVTITSFPKTIKWGVILVDGATTSQFTGLNPRKSDFDEIFFSEGVWNGLGKHPDGDRVFGSVKDYYLDQSLGNIIFTGKNGQPEIVNQPDPNNNSMPDWLELPEPLDYYQENDWTYKDFLKLCYKEAVVEYGKDHMAQYEVYTFVYRGRQRTTRPFVPRAQPITDNITLYSGEIIEFNKDIIIIGETEDYFTPKFTNIGVHCHELGHGAFGFADEYKGDTNTYNYNLMSQGNMNGGSWKGACPAPISALYKVRKGWVSANVINLTNEQADVIVERAVDGSPLFYKLAIPNSQEFFVIEYWNGLKYEQFSYSNSGAMSPQFHSIAYPNGILIWHGDPEWHGTDNFGGNPFDFVQLEDASNAILNNPSKPLPISSFFPKDNTLSQDFSNTSIPGSNLRDGTLSGLSINNIRWFILNARVDIFNDIPKVPTGFSINSQGSNLILSWNLNPEKDIAGYKIYQSLDGTPYTLLHTVDRNTNTWTDNGVIIGSGKFLPWACYKISAYDAWGKESSQTSPDCINYSGLNKSANVDKVENVIPENFYMKNAYPNPFNSKTRIAFGLKVDVNVRLAIYDLNGKLIEELVNDNFSAGSYTLSFEASELSSGTYIYRIVAGEYVESKKFSLIK